MEMERLLDGNWRNGDIVVTGTLNVDRGMEIGPIKEDDVGERNRQGKLNIIMTVQAFYEDEKRIMTMNQQQEDTVS